MPPRLGGRALPSWLREEIRKRTQTESKTPDELQSEQQQPPPQVSLLAGALAPFSVSASTVATSRSSALRPTDSSEAQSWRSRWEEDADGAPDSAQSEQPVASSTSGIGSNSSATLSLAAATTSTAATAEKQSDEPDSDMETEAAAAKEKRAAKRIEPQSTSPSHQPQPQPRRALSEEEKSALLVHSV